MEHWDYYFIMGFFTGEGVMILISHFLKLVL